MDDSFFIASFRSRQAVLRLEEEVLRRSGVQTQIVSTPRAVAVGCGLSVRFDERDMEQVRRTAAQTGGGTLIGLSEKLIGIGSAEHLSELAENGDLDHIDLRIKDITMESYDLPANMTAANFGKVSELATKEDFALGLINMIFETAGMMAVFNSRMHKTRDIVLTGNLTQITQAKRIFAALSQMFDVNFIIPERAQYSTVIGAALCAL